MTWVIDDLQVDADGDDTCWAARWRHWIGPKGSTRATFWSSQGRLHPEYPCPLTPSEQIRVPRHRDWVLRPDAHLDYGEHEYLQAYRNIRGAADEVFHLAWALCHMTWLWEGQRIHLRPVPQHLSPSVLRAGEMPDLLLDLRHAYRSWCFQLDAPADLVAVHYYPRDARYDKSWQVPPAIVNHVKFVHNARKEVNPMRHYKNRLTQEEIDLLRSISPELLDSLGHDPRRMDVATNAFTNVALRLEAEFRALYALQKVEFERALRQSNLVSEPEPEPISVG